MLVSGSIAAVGRQTSSMLMFTAVFNAKTPWTERSKPSTLSHGAA
jgi:hypothetical protein